MPTINGVELRLSEGDCAKQSFVNLACTNPDLVAILKKLPELGVEDCWLVSGGLVQSVWNALGQRSPDYGIVDYDIIYFDPDPSWECEDRVIRRGKALFRNVAVPVEIRNQARVHLWYAEKYGRPVPPLKSACQSLWRYPSRTTAVAVRMRGDGRVDLCAPFGVRHALNMKTQPNRRLDQPLIYGEKAQRWKDAWPELDVVPW